MKKLEKVVAPRSLFVAALDDHVAEGAVVEVEPELAASLREQGWSRPGARRARSAKKSPTKKSPTRSRAAKRAASIPPAKPAAPEGDA